MPRRRQAELGSCKNGVSYAAARARDMEKQSHDAEMRDMG